ncbi:5922_t:CDS:2 [Funneliformis mosseae]|uniref:5922_t:CDS:1 n=1 Tax=Funneliformis mosseae TaxID=27381 RepID=A0A9N8WPC1_FUNMO|nr:5922_t:CDS:2 [Funneliformis mosseae]
MEKLHASDISWDILFNGYHEPNDEFPDLNTDIPNREFPESPLSQTKVICNHINEKSESILDKTHRKANRGINKFLCQHSGYLKNFRDNHQLKIHERKHTGENPRVYPGCGKGFSQKNNLVIHQRGHEARKKHTDEKPYVCNDCNLKFRRKGSLKKHEKTEKHKRASRL